MPRLVAHLFNFTRRVRSFERGEVDHVEHHHQALHLGAFFDAACLETAGALDDANLIDWRGRDGEFGGSHSRFGSAKRNEPQVPQV